MISAGEVGAVFIIKDEASAVLKRLMDQFNVLEGTIDRVKRSLAELKFPPGFNTSIKNMGVALKGVGEASDAAAASFSGSFAKMDESVRATQTAVANLAKEIRGVGAESRALGPSIRNGGRRTASSSDPNVGFTTPRVHGPLGTSAHPEGDGIGTLIAGTIAAWLGGKILGEGGKLTDQKMLLANMGGISDAEISKTVSAAQAATLSVMGTTISENVKGMRELIGVMPNLDEARDKYPAVMRVAKLMEGITGKPAEDSLQILAKAVELRGGGMDPFTRQLDPARFEREVKAAGAAIIAGGGLVTDRSLYQFMQTAGPNARMMSDPIAFYKTALTAIMDMGGFRAGTSTAALGRQLLGGKMTGPTADAMDELGLLVPGKWHKTRGGVSVEVGGVQGEDVIKDPEQGFNAWMNKILAPALAAKHITDQASIQQILMKVFGTATGQRLAGLYVQNGPQIERDAQLISNVDTNAAYLNMVKNGYGANVTNAIDAFTNMMQSVGSANTGQAISVMQKFASIMNSIAGGALEHPDAAAGVTTGLIGGGLTAVGSWLSRWGLGKLGFAGAGRALSKFLGPIGALLTFGDAVDVADPKGNFGGFTTPFDNWIKAHTGIDPSNVPIGVGLPDPTAKPPTTSGARTGNPFGWSGFQLGPSVPAFAPPPKIENKVNVQVTVNGVVMPASVRVTNGSYVGDGRDTWYQPDSMHGPH